MVSNIHRSFCRSSHPPFPDHASATAVYTTTANIHRSFCIDPRILAVPDHAHGRLHNHGHDVSLCPSWSPSSDLRRTPSWHHQTTPLPRHPHHLTPNTRQIHPQPPHRVARDENVPHPRRSPSPRPPPRSPSNARRRRQHPLDVRFNTSQDGPTCTNACRHPFHRCGLGGQCCHRNDQQGKSFENIFQSTCGQHFVGEKNHAGTGQYHCAIHHESSTQKRRWTLGISTNRGRRTNILAPPSSIDGEPNFGSHCRQPRPCRRRFLLAHVLFGVPPHCTISIFGTKTSCIDGLCAGWKSCRRKHIDQIHGPRKRSRGNTTRGNTTVRNTTVRNTTRVVVKFQGGGVLFHQV
jgi:hypothetical protein